ncbi:MAG: VanZ family protein [Bacillaceae bacterium]
MKKTKPLALHAGFIGVALLFSFLLATQNWDNLVVRILPFADAKLFLFFRIALAVIIYFFIESIYYSIKTKGIYIGRFVVYALFFMYAIFMFFLLFYGREHVTNEGTVNLQPFHTISSYYRAYKIGNADFLYVFTNIIGNIILFIPIGVILVFITRSKVNIFFLFLISIFLFFMVEYIQVKLMVGSFDVDDILLNVIGCMIGILYSKKRIS